MHAHSAALEPPTPPFLRAQDGFVPAVFAFKEGTPNAAQLVLEATLVSDEFVRAARSQRKEVSLLRAGCAAGPGGVWRSSGMRALSVL